MKKGVRQEVEELTNRWKRACADYQNLEKRYQREKADFVAYANTNLILRLLAVWDHLTVAQEYLRDRGLSLALQEFKRVLAEEGLTEIRAQGEIFNPEEMEAIEAVVGEKDKVLAVVRPGYRLKDKVIRAAKVKVGRGKTDELP